MIKQIIYDQFLSTEHRKYDPENITFAPSYFSSCARQTFWKKTNEKATNPISSASYLKMHFGTKLHESLQDILVRAGVYESGEEKKSIEYEGLIFNYRIDGLLKINNKKYIMEIKTVYASGYNSVEKEPKKDHVLQLALYMLFENIHNGVLLYVGRDNGFMVEYTLLRKDGKFFLDGIEKNIGLTIADGVEKLKRLKFAIDSRELPDRDFKISMKNMVDKINFMFQKDKVRYKTAWQCSYCGYYDKCWASELREIENNSFYIDGKFIK